MIVIVIHVVLLLTGSASALSITVCPNCGEMEVPYPLSTQEGCGDPNYRLYCNDHSLEFKSQVEAYYRILSIDAVANKLVIGTPEIQKEMCSSSDLTEGGLKLDESLPFNISNRNTVMLFNCSENILLSPLNCSANSPCRLFEKVPEGSACRNTLCCSYLKDASITAHRIRIRPGGCSAYTSIVNLHFPDSPETWNYGIELQWSSPS
ncbi:wall-associated receptor kinase-like 20 [Aristolochia californica]|uniref:wall-associated receptor kinase-like 20 n=1 Tax=Aristolochia californica TaxID=171875 RepID=UPI0035E2DE52